ncbi:12941_t:CDS:2, partial [Entrophospora sp. SA101]
MESIILHQDNKIDDGKNDDDNNVNIEDGGSDDELKENSKFEIKKWIKNKSSNAAPVVRRKLEDLASKFIKFLGFVGPGYVIAVGYLDPGNWATDLAGGSQFGYSLLFIILCSNFMAMLLQSLSIKLGVVTGMACKVFYPKYVGYVLYVLAELAIIACDLAEVIGSAIALKMLFGLALPWGVAVTSLDVIVILFIYRDDDLRSSKILEGLVMLLVAIVGICFVLELRYSEPNPADVLKGYLPSSGIFTDSRQLYIAIGIIGATVMPHNLYLHSHLVKVRKHREESKEINNKENKLESGQDIASTTSIFQSIVSHTITYSTIDSTAALTFALFVNSSILIVAASNFFYNESGSIEVADLFDAFDLLNQYLGKAAGTIFALALLIAGQSSTLTATIAGQIVMEGFLGWTIRPWLRRLLTRIVAIVPAMLIAIFRGEQGLNEMLVASQVALSIQLPFAVIPLVYFTSSRKCMEIDIRK